MSEAWDELINGIEDAFRSVGSVLGEWIPKIIVALLILVVGRWILKMVRRWVERLLDTQTVNNVFDKAGITAGLQPSGKSAAALTAMLIYAMLLVMLWLIVFRILEVEPIVGLLERLLAVLPLILVAAALVLIAAAVGNFVADLLRPTSQARNVSWLPTVVRVVILLAGVLAALDLLDIRFAEDVVKIIVAAAGIALAVAFGVGGIDTAKLWWRKYATPKD